MTVRTTGGTVFEGQPVTIERLAREQLKVEETSVLASVAEVLI